MRAAVDIGDLDTQMALLYFRDLGYTDGPDRIAPGDSACEKALHLMGEWQF